MKNVWAMGLLLSFFAIAGSGCSTISDFGAPGGAAGVSEADRHIKMDVQNRLQEDAVAGRYLFGVDSREGIVTLFGSVPDEGTRRRVISVAQGTPGVRGVNDRLKP